jgi:hypothetical protein
LGFQQLTNQVFEFGNFGLSFHSLLIKDEEFNLPGLLTDG